MNSNSVKLNNLIKQVPAIEEMLQEGKPYFDKEITVSTGTYTERFLSTGKPIKNERGEITGGDSTFHRSQCYPLSRCFSFCSCPAPTAITPPGQQQITLFDLNDLTGVGTTLTDETAVLKLLVGNPKTSKLRLFPML